MYFSLFSQAAFGKLSLFRGSQRHWSYKIGLWVDLSPVYIETDDGVCDGGR